MSTIKNSASPPDGLQEKGARGIWQVVRVDDELEDHQHHQGRNMIEKSIRNGSCERSFNCFPLLRLALNLVLVLAIPFPSQVCQALIQVPNRHTVASIPGDLVLGILVPVHERPSPKQAQTRTCGTVREQYGIQRVEVAFKTIDSINADPNILPNITLGIEIRDSCWHSPIALEQSIEFIRDAMAASEQSQQPQLPAAPPPSGTYQPAILQAGQQQQQLGPLLAPNQGSARSMRQQHQQDAQGGNSSQQHLCAPYMKQQLQLQQASKKIKNLVGVVGPASSGDTVQVQNLLQLFNMPQVGYSATSRDLSNKNFFKYFLRVVPSDKLQAQVLIDLMLAHNWTYITVVYTEGSYGSSLMNAFRERAQEAGICFATLESMPPNADDAEFDELIEAIQNHRNARVVICMCEGRSIGRLFAGFKRKNVNNEYLVVGSDGWADRFDVVERQEEIALGGISIRIHSAYVHDFDDHYFALNPLNNHRNPWFAEFWEQRFQCNLEYNQQQQQQPQQQTSASQRPAYIRPLNAKVYNRTCTGRESLRQNYKQDAKMAFVQKSIITMALGLDSMQRALCGLNKPGLCPEMLPINGSTFLQHLMNVSFTFLDELVYFDEQGDPPGKYEILNFQRKKGLRAPLSAGAGELSFPDTPAYDTPTSSPDDSTVLAGKPDQDIRQQHNYDSYATLKVHRSPGVGSLQQHQLARRQLALQSIRRQQQQQVDPYVYSASDYSATNSYEYVHVGSWKSSDGLSLFGEIQWPTRATTFQHYPSLSGGGSGSSQGPTNGSMASTGGAHSPSTGSSSDPSNAIAGNATSNQQQDFGQDASGGLLGGYLNPNPGDEYQPDGSGPAGPTVSSLQVAAPKSVCALPCARGHAKKIQSDSVKCCWVCVPCRPREYLFNEFKCKACEKGWWPNRDQTGCEQIPIEHFDWRSLEASVSIGTAIIGLILTLTTASVFIKHNNTPVVKSTTRELSYMILFSMFLCYINTFFLITKTSQISCFVTRILPGFSFAMMYGALVTKTNRIARILAGSKKKIITRRPYFMSATAQVLITWLIVLVECAIIVVMLIREPADKTHEYPSDERVVLVCNTTTMGIMAPLGFDFFLIAMCTLYAFKTRNVPENFNEAKFIGFTMYTTLVIWIAFVVIYLSSEHKVTTLCLCISFSALFALFLLFFPRCYIIIFKPEKNNRSYFKTTKNVRCHIGYQLGASPNQTANAADKSGNGSGGGKQNDNDHQQRMFLASLCEMANQKSADCNDGSEFYFDELSSQLADELATALTLEGGAEQQQRDQQVGKGFRGRTSCCKVSPAATMRQQASELRRPLASSAGTVTTTANNWPAAQTTIKDNNNQMPADEIAQNNDKTNWVTSASKRQEFGAGARSKRRVNSDFAARPYTGRATTTSANSSGEEPTKARRDSEFASAAGDETNRPLLINFFSNIRSAFARRSRRKESDKTATIQQHLRAIRHAENLDRQTHFRRSQVQRLIQRFDSNTAIETQNWPMPATSRQRHQSGGHLQPAFNVELCKQQNLHFSQQLREFLGDQQAEQFQRLNQSEESRRLLAAMSQLIGYENLWRLASVLSRYCKQQQQQQDQTTDQLGPLDLRRAADRRLALVWLRFLIQMAQKALESVQLLVSAGAVTANGPQAPLGGGARGLLRARASLSAQQSRDLITLGLGSGSVLRGDGHAPLNSHQTPPLKTSMDLNLSKFQVQAGSIRSSASLDNKLMLSAGGETSGGDNETHQSGLVVELATNDQSGAKGDAAQRSPAAGKRLESNASGQTTIEAAKVTKADTEWQRVNSTTEFGESCATLGGNSNGQTRRAPEDNKQCDDEDPIKRALERITGQTAPDESYAEVGNDRHHRHHHHHHHHHRHHHHQQHLSMSNKSQQQSARLTMNLNRGDEVLETALSLRRSLAATTTATINTTTSAPMATATRADKQKQLATATDMNEEVVLVPGNLLGQRDQRRPGAKTARLVPHNSNYQQHKQKQGPSGGGEATWRKNWMNSPSMADDKDQDTRLHFEPTPAVKNRDNEPGELVATNSPNHCGRSEAASSNNGDSRKPNNLPPNTTTTTTSASLSSNEPQTTRLAANREPINEPAKMPLDCCCCAASARASDGNVAAASNFSDRPSRRSVCSSSGQRQQQQRSASGSLGRRARCCSCCCGLQVCCCPQRARHHHQQRPVSASTVKSRP